MASTSKQVSFDSRYVESLLLDESNIQSGLYATGRELLKQYSKIPDDKIASHVASVVRLSLPSFCGHEAGSHRLILSRQQRRAYALCPYPCIGLLRFLICSLSDHSIYPTILSRIKGGATYLDIGCCFGQDLRKLAHDGAPTNKCTAVDLEPGFFPLSEDLFLDKGRLSARFVGADVFQTQDPIWLELASSIDIVHASSFFHLFGLGKQRLIAEAICRILRPVPGSVVLGLQLSAAGDAGNIPIVNEEEPSYCHSAETMQKLWDDAGRAAGLRECGLKSNVDLNIMQMPDAMKVGLLANPEIANSMWVVTLMESNLER